MEDCSVASLYIQLEAEALGLGSCWVQINRRFYDDDITSNEYIHQQFNIPDRLEVLSVIGIGYKAVERPPMSDHEIIWNKVSVNKFGDVFDKQ